VRLTETLAVHLRLFGRHDQYLSDNDLWILPAVSAG
jgi:hypothetical protein